MKKFLVILSVYVTQLFRVPLQVENRERWSSLDSVLLLRVHAMPRRVRLRAS